MRVKRQEVLQRLESVQPGLALREEVEQSSCFVFKEGRVYTFNNRILCSKDCDIGFQGAVISKPLLGELRKYPEEEVVFETTKNTLVMKGKNKFSEFRMESDILLPIESVEIPKKWTDLHEDFTLALETVIQSAGKNEQMPILTCVHITPEYMEACDNIQAIRYRLPTAIDKDTVIPRDIIKCIIGLGMTEVSETKTWLHFKNSTSLVVSLRRHMDDYPPMEGALAKVAGKKAKLPGGLKEALGRVEEFSAENPDQNLVTVELRHDRMKITGVGSSGKHVEMKKIVYSGDNIVFMIPPKLLMDISEKHPECIISQEKLVVDTGKFIFVSSLGAP